MNQGRKSVVLIDNFEVVPMPKNGNYFIAVPKHL
jgi:hypothetical protein